MNLKDAFVPPDSPILKQIAKAIKPDEIKSPKTIEIIDKMLLVACGEQKDPSKPLFVGLSAPQIGTSQRIILVDTLANGKGQVGNLRVFINPEVTWQSKKEEEWYEGCYSTNCQVEGVSGGVCGIVSRPITIRIRALDTEGKPIEEELSGYTARIFQHETDHLNGLEFVSHITDLDKLHLVKDEEFPQYRNQEGWRNWPRKCPWEFWKRLKGIQ